MNDNWVTCDQQLLLMIIQEGLKVCTLFTNIRANTFHFQTFIVVPQCLTKSPARQQVWEAQSCRYSAHSSFALRRDEDRCARNGSPSGFPWKSPESWPCEPKPLTTIVKSLSLCLPPPPLLPSFLGFWVPYTHLLQGKPLEEKESAPPSLPVCTAHHTCSKTSGIVTWLGIDQENHSILSIPPPPWEGTKRVEQAYPYEVSKKASEFPKELIGEGIFLPKPVSKDWCK